MKASLFYRIAAILLALFAAGHTIGFRKTDPRWGVDALLAMMKGVHFDAQGFSRSYWDFYVGFGLFVSLLLAFAALVAWQLARLPDETLRAMPLLRWSLPICFAAQTWLAWKYFFIAPIVFSIAITGCFVLGAWLPRNSRDSVARNSQRSTLSASSADAS
jgi:hypothetical protein